MSHAALLILIPTYLEAEHLLRGSFEDLLPELRLHPAVPTGHRHFIGLCGFGLAVSGAGAARCFEEVRSLTGHLPLAAVLMGFGGTYDTARVPLGTLVRGRSVTLHGIGAGEGAEHLPGAEFGFPSRLPWGTPASDSVESYPLADDGAGRDLPEVNLLSVTSTAAHASQAVERHRRHPEAAVEEMEGYAVAVAAAAWGIPLSIIRAVSNECGERRQEQWRTTEAAAGLRTCLRQVIFDI